VLRIGMTSPAMPAAILPVLPFLPVPSPSA